MEVQIEHRPGRSSVVHITPDESDDLTALADSLALAENAGQDALTWVHGASQARDEVMLETGRQSSRTLLQMRRPLPAEPSDLTTRAFTDDDLDDFIRVNNRAFAWHPEQGGLDADRVQADMNAPWFDPDGFRLLHIDGTLAGFCWTKVHAEPEPLGEIYVVALDPDFTGRGLGKPITLAGLEWLSGRGLKTAMLFVESDNAAAVATYEALGFRVHRTDRLWEVVA